MREILEQLPQGAFRTEPLGAAVAEGPGRVAGAVAAGNATLLAGAGISAALPTRLPTGAQLANRLTQALADQGHDLSGDVADPSDLGRVAAAVETRIGRPNLVRLIRTSAEWDGAMFNLAHLVIALLTTEGLLGRVLTVNWDRKISEAGKRIHGSALDLAFDADSLSAATTPMCVHLHGQLEQPASLVATQADLESHENLRWAEPMLRAALAETGLVLIGFGAEPEYVLESLSWALEVAAEPPQAVVSDKNREEFAKQSPRLAEMCGIADADDRYVRDDAAEVLGEVLRSFYQGRVKAVLARATERAKTVGAERLPISDEALGALRSFLLERPMKDLLELLWQSNAIATGIPSQARLPTLGAQEQALVSVLAGLLLLASTSDVTSLNPKGAGMLLEAGGLSVDVWPVLPASEVSVTEVVAAVGENAVGFSSIADAAIPLVVLVGGTWGMVPRGGARSKSEGPPAVDIALGQRFPSAVVTLERLQEKIETFDGGAGHMSLQDLVVLDEGQE